MWLLLLLSTLATAVAQPEAEAWQPPINLSQSGVATNPSLLVVAGGDLVAFWQDPFLGYMYARRSGRFWSEPVALTVPFSEPPGARPQSENFGGFYLPTFVIGANGRLHAFWRGARGGLFYSQASLATLNDAGAWSTPQQIAESAVALDVTLADNGRFHLAYVRTAHSPEFPTGVYHRFSDDNGTTWSSPTLVYRSNYLRPLTPRQSHLQIAATTAGVALVWDDPLISRVYFARATGDPLTWTDPQIIDERRQTDDAAAAGPDNITLLAENDTLHLIWRAQRQANTCLLYHQISVDAGISWQEPLVLREQPTCADEYQWVPQLISLPPGTPRLLMVQAGATLYLHAWDGARWSEPQPQPVLTQMTDPITYRQSLLSCQQAVQALNQLFALGCTTGTLTDVWWFERELQDVSDWFVLPKSSPWQEAVSLASTQDNVSNPVLLVDSADRFYLFWLQTVQTANLVGTQNALSTIYYASWTENGWSRVVPLIRLPDLVDQFTAVMAADDRISVIWRNPVSRSFFVTQVDAASAWLPADWSKPQIISSGAQISSPFFLPGQAGDLNAVYAVPLNEGRGIYLIRQSREGGDWREPMFILDAAAAGWDMVDNPVMVRTEDGALHLVVTAYMLQPGAVPIGLYYARSQDDGQTWSTPEPLVTGRVLTSHFASTGHNTLLVAWQEERSASSEFLFRYSPDGGNSWIAPGRLVAADVVYGASAMIVDLAGQAHWLQVAQARDGRLFVRERVWQSGSWQQAESLALAATADGLTSSSLAAAMSRNGRLVVLSAYDQAAAEAGDVSSTRVVLAERPYELPSDLLPPPVIATPTSEPPALPTAVASPTPDDFDPLQVPTLAPDLVDPPLRPPTGDARVFSILVGVAPAALIVVTISALGLWVSRARKR